MGFNYDNLEQELNEDLEAGKYDIDTMPNEGKECFGIEDGDYEAFEEHLKSDAAISLCKEVFVK